MAAPADGSPGRIRVLGALAVCIATWLGSEFGLMATFPETGAATLFPPYAVLAAALLLTPPRDWWIYLLASFAGHMLVEVIRGAAAPPEFLAWTEIANAVRALVAATAWRLLVPDRPRFDTLENTAIFLGVAGLLAPAAGAFVGAAVIVLHGRVGPDAYWSVWSAWFLSNAIVGVTLLPLLLAAVQRARSRRPRLRAGRAVELAVLLAAVVAVAGAALGFPTDQASVPALLAALMPLLLWAAIRFGVGVTSASLLAVTVSAVAGAMNGWGPFASGTNDARVLALHSFIALTSVPCLLLAALVRERRQVAAALRESEERYRLATSAGSVGVWDWDLSSGEVYVDPVVKGALGYASSEIQDHLADWSGHLHPADAERLVAEARAYRQGNSSTFESEYRMVHREGTIRWFFSRGATVREVDERPIRLIGTTTDITGRKLAELELQERRRELAHLGRVAAAGQMAGALAHELRQPLTAILANAQTAQNLLAREVPDLAELREILSDIEHDDLRAGEVITRLRGLLKKGETAAEQLRLGEVVQDGLDIANADLLARGVAVKRELDGSLPAVHGDRVELQQVLVNLLLNACDAMGGLPAADRRLTVGTTTDGAGFAVAYVADRGIGIAQPDLERIFDPFVTSKPDGLGLGLSICRSIAAAHRGRLWAANNPDGGATFFLALPTAP